MTGDFIVFDLETIGLSPSFNEIIQIAATRLRRGRVVQDEKFFSYVRPTRPISPFITSYTGISNRDVASAPSVKEVLRQFSKFVGEAELIAHNGQRFDAKFLAAACQQQRLKSRPVAIIDSIHFSRRLFGTVRGTGHGLDVVLERMKVRIADGRRHDARGDVSGLATAVERMWEKLRLDGFCSGLLRAETHLPATG